jgi:hypothetical protein
MILWGLFLLSLLHGSERERVLGGLKSGFSEDKERSA